MNPCTGVYQPTGSYYPFREMMKEPIPKAMPIANCCTKTIHP